MTRITISKPDDWHLHLRDGAGMRDVLHHSAACFGRAIIMPNLSPPIVSLEDAVAYQERITAALPEGHDFEPLMTLYLTDLTSAYDVRRAASSGVVRAVKLYPAGATTNSDSGVTDLSGVDETLAAIAECGLPLLVHGEVTDSDIDFFDREAVFIDRVLGSLVDAHPSLKVVLEHVTTAQGVAFVENAREGVAATVTPHHLMMNRNAIFEGGLNPHHYCLPVLKREPHRRELIRAATSGSKRFFLGTDSAPHPRHSKESSCGCAGMFSAHAALSLYAEVFDRAGALDQLETFASHSGADFYGLPRNEERVTLVRETWTVPEIYPFGENVVVPLRAGRDIAWKIEIE